MPEAPRPTAAAAGSPARELKAWVLVAAAALGLAGVFALLLAISRIPGVEAVFPWPVGFFHKGLVIHVVFSFVVWFLAVFGALAALMVPVQAGRQQHFGLGGLAAAGTAVAMPLLFVPALLDRGEATLNNYIPVIIDPLYYAGIALLFAAQGAVALRLLAAVRGARLSEQPATAAVAAAAMMLLLAVAAFGLALSFQAGVAPSHAFNEELFWGGGHILQFMNTALLIGAWVLLAAAMRGGRAMSTMVLLVALALLLFSVLPAPLLYFVFEPFSAAHTEAFTLLQYALGPPALLAAWAVLRALPRPWPWAQPAFLCLALSILLFVVGGFLGLFVDGADTRTPAHYHGVIAAVTLAFMGLFYVSFLPRLGCQPPPERWQRRQIHLFAWGQLFACLGLFAAGGHGAPRKVAGAAQGLDGLIPVIGLGMNGLGGLIAVIGGVIFVVLVLAALARGTVKALP